MFDLITPMVGVREIAVSLTKIVNNMCTGAVGPAGIVVYPFLDINLAKGIHNLVNSILFAVIQVPSITYQRCKNNGGIVMCLPDFEPVFNMANAGLRSFGRLADNWLDVSSIIVQKSLGLPTPQCDGVPLSLSPANYSRSVFGNNRTLVVGLTPGLYAVTDGFHTQYFSHYNSQESEVVTNSWPVPVDVSFGVAAVTYYTGGDRDAEGNPSTAMLGCSCTDNSGAPPMRIRCALALRDSGALGETISVDSDLTFEVVFQKRSTSRYLTCREAQISVQSVR